MLGEFDPARAAGGDHGQPTTVGKPLQQFMAFLHDRQIRCKNRVEHLVKPQTAQSGGKLPGNDAARLCPHDFTELHAYGRSGLNQHMFIGIGQGGPHLLGVIHFRDGARGTDQGALTALDAFLLG